MTRDELVDTVKRSTSDTLVAYRFRAALGIPQPRRRKRGRVRDRDAKSRKYRGAKKLMAQRHGVRL